MTNIIIWDNGEEFIAHRVWFIETELELETVRPILESAATLWNRCGGVVATIPAESFAWSQDRRSTFGEWFDQHGEDLINWRAQTVAPALLELPRDLLLELAELLFPTSRNVLRAELGLPPVELGGLEAEEAVRSYWADRDLKLRRIAKQVAADARAEVRP